MRTLQVAQAEWGSVGRSTGVVRLPPAKEQDVSLVPAVGSSPLDRGEEARERVTGRKARGLQTEEIGYKCRTFLFFLSLKQQEETSSLWKCFS